MSTKNFCDFCDTEMKDGDTNYISDTAISYADTQFDDCTLAFKIEVHHNTRDSSEEERKHMCDKCFLVVLSQLSAELDQL